MASEELRRAWAELIDPGDYEMHMAAIGQAEANALLIRELILSPSELPGSGAVPRLLFAGAGTGQMFDYVSPDFLRPNRVTFSDIRKEFLTKLRDRLAAQAFIDFEIVVDDIEKSQVSPIDAVAIVLVLEHVDWRAALKSLIENGARRFFIIIQKNPAEQPDAVTPTRVLPGSMANISPKAKPSLVEQTDLKSFLAGAGFELIHTASTPVPDGKSMLGLVFDRAN